MINLKVGTVDKTRVDVNGDGGVQVRLVDVILSDPQDVQTVQLWTKEGEDYNPAPGSKILVLHAGSAWGIGIAVDDEFLPAAAAGEKYIYALDPTGTTIMSSIKLFNDGSVEIAGLSGLGKVTINPDGTISGIGPVGNFSLDGITGQFSVNGNFTVDI